MCGALTSERVLSLNDSIQWRRLDSFRQEVTDGAEPQQLNAQGDFVQRSPKDLRSHMGLQSANARTQLSYGGIVIIVDAVIPFKSRATAEVKTESGSDSARPPFPLLQVGFGGPHGGVVSHVVVRCEQFHLLPAHTETYTHGITTWTRESFKL